MRQTILFSSPHTARKQTIGSTGRWMGFISISAFFFTEASYHQGLTGCPRDYLLAVLGILLSPPELLQLKMILSSTGFSRGINCHSYLSVPMRITAQRPQSFTMAPESFTGDRTYYCHQTIVEYLPKRCGGYSKLRPDSTAIAHILLSAQ